MMLSSARWVCVRIALGILEILSVYYRAFA